MELPGASASALLHEVVVLRAVRSPDRQLGVHGRRTASSLGGTSNPARGVDSSHGSGLPGFFAGTSFIGSALWVVETGAGRTQRGSPALRWAARAGKEPWPARRYPGEIESRPRPRLEAGSGGRRRVAFTVSGGSCAARAGPCQLAGTHSRSAGNCREFTEQACISPCP